MLKILYCDSRGGKCNRNEVPQSRQEVILYTFGYCWLSLITQLLFAWSIRAWSAQWTHKHIESFALIPLKSILSCSWSSNQSKTCTFSLVVRLVGWWKLIVETERKINQESMWLRLDINNWSDIYMNYIMNRSSIKMKTEWSWGQVVKLGLYLHRLAFKLSDDRPFHHLSARSATFALC